MIQLFNKNGLVVKNNLKAIQEELVRGTGFVIGEKVSAFVERESLHEKNIVVSVDDGETTPMEKRFVVGRMKEALELQGLLSLAQYDAIRGTCTSGARRESPSRVFGILTPGQHQFVMDDGQPIGTTLPGQPSPPAIDQGIRIRTAGGAQLLLNDEKGIVYIINKQGTAWVELTNEGKMDVFCTDDISYHSLKDFNLHVDGDINIQSKGSIKIRAEGSDGININATTGDFQMKTAMNYVIQADLDGSLITAGQTTVKAARLDLNGGSATDAVPPEPAPLVGNVSVLQSVCTRVPEHEPWLGHEDKKLMPLGEGLAPGFTSGGGPS